MDPASCGPSNALTNLSKHSQRDNTLQNEASSRYSSRNSPASFKSNNFNQIDRNLNSEFERFQGGGNHSPALGREFAQGFQQHQRLQQQQQHHQQQQQQPGFHQPQTIHANQKWVSDFSQLNIGQQHQHQHQQPQQQQQQNGWQTQFMQQNTPQQQIDAERQAYTHQGPGYIPSVPQVAPFNLSMRTDLSERILTEHQEVHQQEQFNQEFDQIEKEMSELEHEQQEAKSVPPSDMDKEEFARTAQQVHNSMMAVQNEETSSKFQNSNFLKLMSNISNRSVELDGDKLVDTESREDIREHLADPLRDQRSAEPEGSNAETFAPSQLPIPTPPTTVLPINPVKPMNVSLSSSDEAAAREREQLSSHLPDPLAHIRDGGLDGITDPLMAAKIISGNQIKDSHWFNGHDDDDWLDMTEDRPPQLQVPQTKSDAPTRPGSILNERDQEVYDDYRHDDDYR